MTYAPRVAASILGRLQAWYLAQCDGDWEHEYGVKIDTLDNPGWWVEIELTRTDTGPDDLPPLKDHRSEHNWIQCRVEDEVYKAAGGPENLEELLSYFLDRVGGSPRQVRDP
jgi:hypothetical protein